MPSFLIDDCFMAAQNLFSCTRLGEGRLLMDCDDGGWSPNQHDDPWLGGNGGWSPERSHGWSPERNRGWSPERYGSRSPDRWSPSRNRDWSPDRWSPRGRSSSERELSPSCSPVRDQSLIGMGINPREWSEGPSSTGLMSNDE